LGMGKGKQIPKQLASPWPWRAASHAARYPGGTCPLAYCSVASTAKGARDIPSAPREAVRVQVLYGGTMRYFTVGGLQDWRWRSQIFHGGRSPAQRQAGAQNQTKTRKDAGRVVRSSATSHATGVGAYLQAVVLRSGWCLPSCSAAPQLRKHDGVYSFVG